MCVYIYNPKEKNYRRINLRKKKYIAVTRNVKRIRINQSKLIEKKLYVN